MARKTEKFKISKVDRITVDIDERLPDIRATMFEGWAKGDDNIEFVASLLRAAYSQGVYDALRDPEGTKEWLRSRGYKVPDDDSD